MNCILRTKSIRKLKKKNRSGKGEQLHCNVVAKEALADLIWGEDTSEPEIALQSGPELRREGQVFVSSH